MKSSLLTKLLSQIGILFILLIGLIIAGGYYFTSEQLNANLITKGQVIATNIAKKVSVDVARKNSSQHQTDLNQLIQNNTDIHFIIITDERGAVLLDTFTPIIPEKIQNTLDPNGPPMISMPKINTIIIKEPIMNGNLGAVYIGMNTQRITTQLIDIVKKVVIPVPLILGLLLIVLLRYMHLIKRSFLVLSNSTKAIKKNRFNLSQSNVTELKKMSKWKNDIGTFSTHLLTFYSELDHRIKKLTETASMTGERHKELKIAQTIQSIGLGKLNSDGYSNLTASAYFKGTKTIGSDFYHIIEQNNKVIVMIGDVSGTGIQSALFMKETLTSIQTACRYLTDPSEIMTIVNEQLSSHNPNTLFASLFLAIIDPKTGIMNHVNAGHPCPIILTDTCSPLKTIHHPVMGINKSYFYPSMQTKLPANSILFLYTNGITEAQNKTNDFFSEARLIETLNQLNEPNSNDATALIKMTLEGFTKGQPIRDDMTALSISFTPTPIEIPNPLTLSFRNDIDELIKLQHAVTIFSKKFNIDERNEKSINLVLEELCSNTIYYGYEDNQPRDIQVTLTLDANQIVVKILDDARPFNPLTDAPDIDEKNQSVDRQMGGLGIHIIKKMTDNMVYERERDTNVITITKELS